MSVNCNEKSKEKFHFLGFDGSGSGGGVDIEVTGDFPINVQETILSDQKKYNVTLIEHEALLATFDINNIEIVPDDNNFKNGDIPLKGVTVNEVLLGWTFSQDNQSVDVYQEIDGVQVTPNTIKSLNKTGLSLVYDSVIADRTFTLFGDDEQNLANSTVTKQKILNFGNGFWYGESNFENDDNLLRTLLTGLTHEIRTDENVIVSPTSLSASVYVYIAIPTDIAVNTIFKDLSSPITVDPMKIHKSNFSLSNGFISDTYTVYISKQGALRDSIITPE